MQATIDTLILWCCNKASRDMFVDHSGGQFQNNIEINWHFCAPNYCKILGVYPGKTFKTYLTHSNNLRNFPQTPIELLLRTLEPHLKLHPKNFKHIWNFPELPFELLSNPHETNWKLPWNILQFSLKHPWTFFKYPWTFLETLLKHLETFLKHPWHFPNTPVELFSITLESP